MKIYIASSWKNQHAVEMLTSLLNDRGHQVLSFVENNYGERKSLKGLNFEEWCNSLSANQAFSYDTAGAMFSDLVIYLGPSGKDAAAEVGAAFAKGVPIVGLYAKGEDFGLMRKMVDPWLERYPDLLEHIDGLQDETQEAGRGRA